MQSRIIISCLQHQKQYQQHVTIVTNLWEEPLFKGLDEHTPPPFPQYPLNTKSRSVMGNSRGSTSENFFKLISGLINFVVSLKMRLKNFWEITGDWCKVTTP